VCFAQKNIMGLTIVSICWIQATGLWMVKMLNVISFSSETLFILSTIFRQFNVQLLQKRVCAAAIAADTLCVKCKQYYSHDVICFLHPHPHITFDSSPNWVKLCLFELL
jgi:hypothetical protein